MNTEFKKIKSTEETRYVLETASAGATSSGAIATVPGSSGQVRKRQDNILAQEADKKQDAPKPRNFVAKNAKMGGAGAHRDKKKEQKQGGEKHKKPFAEGFNGEYDDEAGMAHSNLLTSARAVIGLLKTIKDRDNLPEWGQEKIAKAEMMLVSVWDYLQSQKQMGNDPQQGVAEGSDHDDDYSTASFEKWKKQKEYEKEYDKKKPAKPIVPDNKDKKKGVAEGDMFNIIQQRAKDRGEMMSKHSHDSRERAHQRHQDKLDKIQQRASSVDDRLDKELGHASQQRMDRDEYDTQRRKDDDADTRKTFDMMRDRLNRMQYKNQRDVDPKQLKKISDIKYKSEGTADNVDSKGRTQQEWLKLVKSKFPTARIAQAKMMGGPIIAYLDDGRKLSWNKVEQGVAEVAGPEKCWPGHRKVGTKPGTGKNAGKRVNDCEKIGEQGVAEGAGMQELINSAETMTLDQFVDVYGEENAHIWHKVNGEQGVAEAPEDRTSYQVAKVLFDKGITYDSSRENELINAIGMVLVKELNMSPKQARQLISYDEDFLGDTFGELQHMQQGVAEEQPDEYMESLAQSLNSVLGEKAVSKAQQRFMGMVHAAKKGEKAASPEVAKAAKGMGKKDAKDFAATKHKGLPEKKKSKN